VLGECKVGSPRSGKGGSVRCAVESLEWSLNWVSASRERLDGTNGAMRRHVNTHEQGVVVE